MDAEGGAGHVGGMSDSLDDLLTRADPASAYDDRLDPLLRQVAAGAEDAAGRRRRTARRAGVVGALAAAVLGVGGLGAATGILGLAPTPGTGDWMSEPGVREWTVPLATGESCDVTMTVLPEEVAGERLGLDADEWQATLEAAQDTMDDIDVAAIDVDAAAERYAADAEATRDRLLAEGMLSSELAPRERGDYLRVSATVAEVWRLVEADLSAAGLQPGALMPGWSHSCPGLDPGLGGQR